MAYRDATFRVPGSSLAFPTLTWRIGADALEIASFDSLLAGGASCLALFAASFALGMHAPWFVILVPLLPFLFRPRHALRFDRNGAWALETIADIPWRCVALGKHPRIANFGYDWGEIGVYPTEPVLAMGLHDDERVVVTEWVNDPEKDADAELVMQLVRDQIARLHG